MSSFERLILRVLKAFDWFVVSGVIVAYIGVPVSMSVVIDSAKSFLICGTFSS